MQVPEGYVSENIERTPSSKRDNSDLTPPKTDAIKKSKMGDESEMPKWAVGAFKDLAKTQDLQKMMDNFEQNCFVPFKTEILGRITKMEDDVKQFPKRLNDLEKDFQNSMGFKDGEIKDINSNVTVLMKDNVVLHKQVE